jgi:hypothetical protein
MPLASGAGRSTRMQIGSSRSCWTTRFHLAAADGQTPDWQIDFDPVKPVIIGF